MTIEHPHFRELLGHQMKCCALNCEAHIEFMSDDGLDYLNGAVDLLHNMLEIYEQSFINPAANNEACLLKLLNLMPWANYACDGVANEVWAWCESLGDDEYWFDELEHDHTWDELPPVVREPEKSA